MGGYNSDHDIPLLVFAAAAKSLQSCPTLCDPIGGSPPGSPVPGILQARTLEWVAISSSKACMHAKLLQSCPTLCDTMDSSPPGSSVHRILKARILEWVASSFSPQMNYFHVNPYLRIWFWSFVALVCSSLKRDFSSRPETEVRPQQQSSEP